jgi:hypothetical protein
MPSIVGQILKRLIGAEVEASVGLLKIESAIVYLNLVKGARSLAKIICLLVLFIILIACGFIMIPIALCLFMPWSPETKTIVAVSFAAGYLVIPFVALLVLFSEKRWLKASRANALLKEALKP